MTGISDLVGGLIKLAFRPNFNRNSRNNNGGGQGFGGGRGAGGQRGGRGRQRRGPQNFAQAKRLIQQKQNRNFARSTMNSWRNSQRQNRHSVQSGQYDKWKKSVGQDMPEWGSLNRRQQRRVGDIYSRREKPYYTEQDRVGTAQDWYGSQRREQVPGKQQFDPNDSSTNHIYDAANNPTGRTIIAPRQSRNNNNSPDFNRRLHDANQQSTMDTMRTQDQHRLGKERNDRAVEKYGPGGHFSQNAADDMDRQKQWDRRGKWGQNKWHRQNEQNLRRQDIENRHYRRKEFGALGDEPVDEAYDQTNPAHVGKDWQGFSKWNRGESASGYWDYLKKNPEAQVNSPEQMQKNRYYASKIPDYGTRNKYYNNRKEWGGRGIIAEGGTPWKSGRQDTTGTMGPFTYNQNNRPGNPNQLNPNRSDLYTQNQYKGPNAGYKPYQGYDANRGY